jgi:hypothetical protein
MSRGTVIRISLLVVSAVFIIFLSQTNASGVTVAVSDGVGTTDAGNGGQIEITTSWTSSGFYTSGTQMTISISQAATSTISDCGSASTDFGGSTGSFGTFTSSSAIFTVTDNVATSTAGSLCLSFGLTTSTATNYSISMLSTSSTTSFTATDFGAVLYYVLGGNEVQVTAQVPASLSFSIRNNADSTNTNVCQLGILSLAQVSFCNYRLRIATNAASGFTTTLQPDEEFNSGGNATITAITNDVAFATGTEAYGIAFYIGATSGGRDNSTRYFDQATTEGGSSIDASLTFDADSTPLTFTSATTVLSYSGPFNPATAPSLITTSLVVHGAAIGAGTPTGNYAHTITYRVTGSF